MSEDRTYTAAFIQRFTAAMALMNLERRVRDRFDRCCHGGAVSYRLSLTFRLDAADRWRLK